MRNGKETKKDRFERCRALIDRQLYDEWFSKTDLDEFIEITGKTDLIGAMRRTNAKYSGDTRHVWGKFIDGTWDSFSWTKCINPQTEIQYLKRVLRVEISSDMAEARISGVCCQYEGCGSFDNLQTDHKDVPFDDIANAFIAQYGIIETADCANGVGNMIKDRNIAALWIQFHASRATYQILCRSHNASKGKRRIIIQ
jgi:hypothetical protein